MTETTMVEITTPHHLATPAHFLSVFENFDRPPRVPLPAVKQQSLVISRGFVRLVFTGLIPACLCGYVLIVQCIFAILVFFTERHHVPHHVAARKTVNGICSRGSVRTQQFIPPRTAHRRMGILHHSFVYAESLRSGSAKGGGVCIKGVVAGKNGRVCG